MSDEKDIIEESNTVESKLSDVLLKFARALWKSQKDEQIEVPVNAILNIINTHYIPKSAPSGFVTVRVPNCHENNDNKCIECTTGKITTPITQEELVEVVGKMLECIEGLLEECYVSFGTPDRIENSIKQLKEALTHNGGRIRRGMNKEREIERCYICGISGDHVSLKSPNDIINYDICVKCWDKFFRPSIEVVIKLLEERGVYGHKKT